ncbi:hypothetical protein [Legionella worsleiensis]|uniref:Uncharacterized protein n=1 Tax=Legionella worsleiensis TaxID=45076 RepID=A0A0W1A6Z2_9GAMM|nr:hypothetical protein [Legionella worsleiensis]KTD76803.1 hypothetical protein Lwor_2028 [Legionella worsleiensis]STY30647.1 Uncharacterised protein [Legionella worsleiensis]
MSRKIALTKSLADFAEWLGRIAGDKTNDEIERIVQQASSLHDQYLSTPEKKIVDWYDFLSQFYLVLELYQKQHRNAKSWWGRLLEVLGFLSPQERSLQQTVDTVYDSLKHAQKERDILIYPGFFFAVLRSLGIYCSLLFKKDPPLQEIKCNQLNYLSHHLMGEHDLTGHELLQGKNLTTSYVDFFCDLDLFITNKHNCLDAKTTSSLLMLRNKIKDAAKIAQLISFFHTMDELSRWNGLSQLTSAIKAGINQLKVYDFMLIPHGYAGEAGGHSTLIECRRINQDEVVFRFINTGDGLIETSSYKTLLKIFFWCDGGTFPMKVSSPISVASLVYDDFIERLLMPGVIANCADNELMNAPLLDLYNVGKLHDDEQFLRPQTNGTCAHSCILEWFKTQVPQSVFVLFSTFITLRANKNLDRYTPPDSDHEASVKVLKKAAKDTILQKRNEYSTTKKQIEAEFKSLHLVLEGLFRKKKKNLPNHFNYAAYYKNKCQSKKLSPEERVTIINQQPLASLHQPKDIIIIRALSALFFRTPTAQAKSARLSDTAQKAILAKQLAGHEAYLNTAKSMIV